MQGTANHGSFRPGKSTKIVSGFSQADGSPGPKYYQPVILACTVLLVMRRGREPSPSGSTKRPTGSTDETGPLSPGDPEAADPQSRDWLTRTLRELRQQAELSASQAAREIGITQSRISRIESGLFLPTEEEVTRLADLYRAPTATRRRLLIVVTDLRAEEAPARIVLQRGAWRIQRRITSIEESAAEICGFTNNLVPCLLQTADYARAVFSDGAGMSQQEVEQAVAARIARSAVIEARQATIVLVMTEGALRWQAGNAQIMTGQLERMARQAVEGKVSIGVIPWTRPVGTFPLHGFSMYDRRAVIIGTRSATAFITDPKDAVTYGQLFDDLAVLASFGQDAVGIITRIAEEYRSLL
jgi:transcriptional regulator with XRE-family HTH domain